MEKSRICLINFNRTIGLSLAHSEHLDTNEQWCVCLCLTTALLIKINYYNYAEED